MEYRILGPLEVLGDDGAVVTLAGVRERTLLATLLLRANHVVSTDRLIDVLWGEEPPPSVRNAAAQTARHRSVRVNWPDQNTKSRRRQIHLAVRQHPDEYPATAAVHGHSQECG